MKKPMLMLFWSESESQFIGTLPFATASESSVFVSIYSPLMFCELNATVWNPCSTLVRKTPCVSELGLDIGYLESKSVGQTCVMTLGTRMDFIMSLLPVEAGFMQHIAVFMTLLAATTGADTRNEIAGCREVREHLRVVVCDAYTFDDCESHAAIWNDDVRARIDTVVSNES